MKDWVKNDIVLYGMIFQKYIRPDMFSWIRHYVVEVCALLSALLVLSLFTVSFSFGLVLKLLQIVEFSSSFHFGFPWCLPFFPSVCMMCLLYSLLTTSPPLSLSSSQRYTLSHVLLERHLVECIPLARNAWCTRTYRAQYIFEISCYISFLALTSQWWRITLKIK